MDAWQNNVKRIIEGGKLNGMLDVFLYGAVRTLHPPDEANNLYNSNGDSDARVSIFCSDWPIDARARRVFFLQGSESALFKTLKG